MYDIEACHYNILKNIGYDMSNIDYENKLKRNIQIGKLMQKNPKLTKLLRNTTESILNEYISRSKITENDIVTRQYDGLITMKPLTKLNSKIPLKLKTTLDIMIISIDRSSFISKYNNQILIKGVPNRYKKIDEIFYKLCNINFLNKHQIFVSLDKIKSEFLNTGDPRLFFIESDDKFGTIFFKVYGQTRINKSSIKIIDSDDIDKNFYFNFYIRPFTESLTVEFI